MKQHGHLFASVGRWGPVLQSGVSTLASDPSDLRKRWQCRHAAMLEPVMYRNVDERRQYICAPLERGDALHPPTSVINGSIWFARSRNPTN